MSCCKKQEIKRLKVFDHASVLAMQTAHLTNVKMAVVLSEHKQYGEYYEPMSYDEAKEKGLDVLVFHTPKGKWKNPTNVDEVLD